MNETLTAQLWLRESVPGEVYETQSAMVDRLLRLERNGTLASVDLETWPTMVYASARWTDEKLQRTMHRLSEYLQTDAVDIVPGMARGTATNVSGATFEFTRLPIMCLVVYDQGDICAVAPRETSSQPFPVEQLLEQLEGESSFTPIPSTI